jgi:hypothetical protein
MGGERADVEMVVLQVADADVSQDVWLAEVLNGLDWLELGATREAIEQAVNRLINAGLLISSESRLKVTAEGRRTAGRLGRYQSAPRAAAWFTQQLESSPNQAPVVWQLSRTDWESGTETARQHKRQKLLARKEIVDGLLDAMGRLDEINALVRGCRGRTEARTAITGVGYTPIQAEFILDTPVGRQTKDALEQLQRRAVKLESSIARLEE